MVNGVRNKFLDVTVLIATKNEEANIAKSILSCEPGCEIYVIDSGSSDRTTEIASDLGAKVLTFAWNGRYPKKRQWALDNINFKTKWILLLDADEEVDQSLWSEIETNISDSKDNVAFFIKKEFHFLELVIASLKLNVSGTGIIRAAYEKTLNLYLLHLELLRCSRVHPFHYDLEQNNQLK